MNPSEPALTVEKEPDYFSRGHFYSGVRPYISPETVWKLPIGTKLYTAESLQREREAGRRERDAEVAEHEHQCSTHYHAWAQCDCAAGTVTKLRAEVKELVEALREIADDYEDRFDMSSPSTNPGMKYVVKQARAVLAKHRREG